MKSEELIDKEIEAIKVVLRVLDPLPPDVRSSVLAYVRRRLQMPVDQIQHTPISGAQAPDAAAAVRSDAAVVERPMMPTHIKALKEKKDPRSASEMAAVVGFYLANLAPQKDRKDRITTKDIDTYFKIAEFPLPKKTQFTLPNAKAAGYLDAVGNGEYKLNAVGHNLVVHSLPRADSAKAAPKRKPAKKAPQATQKR
jgi:hypothetical protein